MSRGLGGALTLSILAHGGAVATIGVVGAAWLTGPPLAPPPAALYVDLVHPVVATSDRHEAADASAARPRIGRPGTSVGRGARAPSDAVLPPDTPVAAPVASGGDAARDGECRARGAAAADRAGLAQVDRRRAGVDRTARAGVPGTRAAADPARLDATGGGLLADGLAADGNRAPRSDERHRNGARPRRRRRTRPHRFRRGTSSTVARRRWHPR